MWEHFSAADGNDLFNREDRSIGGEDRVDPILMVIRVHVQKPTRVVLHFGQRTLGALLNSQARQCVWILPIGPVCSCFLHRSVGDVFHFESVKDQVIHLRAHHKFRLPSFVRLQHRRDIIGDRFIDHGKGGESKYKNTLVSEGGIGLRLYGLPTTHPLLTRAGGGRRRAGEDVGSVHVPRISF